MALKKITGKDIKEALDALTPYGEGDVVWLKELGKTDGGTGLYLIVGWTRDLGYELSDVEANGFTGDNDDYIGYKIGYFNYKPGIRYMLQDFDDFHMPYNLKDDKANGIYKGDVWDTDGYLSNEPSSWDSLASQLNKDAQGIWDTWGENGELDLMESKKNEAAGDSPKKIYRIKSLSTDVYEDDWEDGEGEHVNYWSGSDVLGRKMYKEFSSLGDILRMLNDEYLYIWKDADNIKNWAIFDDPDLKDEIRFDCETMIDVDNRVADESDIESWRKGKKKLFNAHSVLYVTAEYTTYASAAELTEDAKKIGLDTI